MPFLGYMDRFSAFEPGQTTQDPDTGALTTTGETTLLETSCDVQDDSYRLRRTAAGDAEIVADAVVYVPEHVDLSPLETGTRLRITQRTLAGPEERTAEVATVSIFHHRLLIRWT